MMVDVIQVIETDSTNQNSLIDGELNLRTRTGYVHWFLAMDSRYVGSALLAAWRAADYEEIYARRHRAGGFAFRSGQ
jgi:hypothetical protein